jgi:hypothetical protein
VEAAPVLGADRLSASTHRGQSRATGRVSSFAATARPLRVVGLSKSPSVGRLTYMRLVRQEAQQRGVPLEVADAVAQVESAYNPHAVGTGGEIGLMQVRPTTAAMLGHSALQFAPVNARWPACTFPVNGTRIGARLLARSAARFLPMSSPRPRKRPTSRAPRPSNVLRGTNETTKGSGGPQAESADECRPAS